MKRSTFFLLILLLAAPAFAQTGQQFGFLLGGTKRLYSSHDKDAAALNNETLPIDRFRLTHGAKEVFYAVEVEPATWFKIQAGQWNTDVGIVQKDPLKLPRSGTIQHADGIVDYRFTDLYGTTGLFVGLGIYRWSASGAAPDAIHDVPTETNYGYTFGVDGEFPMTRRYAFMVEGAYHWINMSSPVRYVTLMGGVRVAF
ncbi:MAG TPA: hypothetical protein VG323_22315 [Thermoanaerobaculia bacterium]|nr:hypothetical protein [Thermoanaerobaculia bacterium]